MLAIRYALRLLLSRKSQTLLTIAGVAVGTMVLVIARAFTSGFQEDFLAKIVEVAPHMNLRVEEATPPADPILLDTPGTVALRAPRAPDDETVLRNGSRMVEILRTVPGVTAISPVVEASGFLSLSDRTEPARFTGVDPAAEAPVIALPSLVYQGSYDRFSASRDGLLLGSGLARKLSLQVGDRVSAAGPSGRVERLQVAGIFATGVGTYDDSLAFVHTFVARSLAGIEGDVLTGIRMRGRDPQQITGVADAATGATGRDVEDWKEATAPTQSFFRTQQMTSLLIFVFVLVVAGFGISNVLVTVVLEKQRDVAVLKSFGFTRSTLMGIFLTQGVLIGTLGALLGAAAAYGVSWALATYVRFPPPEDSAFLRADHLSISFDPAIYAMVVGAAVVISLVASALPAWRASRYEPVAILRGES